LEIPAQPSGQSLSQIQNLPENSSRTNRVDRGTRRPDAQLQASGGGETGKRIHPRLATSVLVGTYNRPWQGGATGKLGLTQAALAANLTNQLSSNTLSYLHRQNVSASANKFGWCRQIYSRSRTCAQAAFNR
jgi:hypothetical protein